KGYASRVLNRKYGRPVSGTWWAGGGGSRRKLPNARAVAKALEYLRNQPYALLVWIDGGGVPRGTPAPGEPGSGEPGASAPGANFTNAASVPPSVPPGADAPGSPKPKPDCPPPATDGTIPHLAGN